MSHWTEQAVFYHIYPLGMLGAPQSNDQISLPVDRLSELCDWIPHLVDLGANAIYLGPVFESLTHGYDTIDYNMVDRRLGTNDSLAAFVLACHASGIRVILDAVLNHVGREFPPFVDVLRHGEASPYRSWFHGLEFGTPNGHGDPFSYEGWNGHTSLVKLNLREKSVREFLFNSVENWIRRFRIDGLRLDAADCLDPQFMRELRTLSRNVAGSVSIDGFWLMGEVVHGDYRNWANPATLDAVTNYEAYKSLYSSHNDRNYFEMSWTLNRQFGAEGLYRDIGMYNFVDNHDVSRVASVLDDAAHLYPLHILLFTMPGIPSIYYGSEWGIEGRKEPHSDALLRPRLTRESAPSKATQPDLMHALRRLAGIRAAHPALQKGRYRELHVTHEQLSFMRSIEGEHAIVAVNSSSGSSTCTLRSDAIPDVDFVDALSPAEKFRAHNGTLEMGRIDPNWGKILVTV